MIQNLFKTEIFNDLIRQHIPQEYKDEVKLIKLKYNSVIISNRGGYQSPVLQPKGALIDLFEENMPYPLGLLKEAYGIKHNLRLQGFWVNINKSSDYNIAHVHPGCVFSGVFYLKAPKDSGSILFHSPYSDMIEYSDQVRKLSTVFHTTLKIPVQRGLLLLFPSWMKHSVELSNTDSERISLAFNYGW